MQRCALACIILTITITLTSACPHWCNLVPCHKLTPIALAVCQPCPQHSACLTQPQQTKHQTQPHPTPNTPDTKPKAKIPDAAKPDAAAPKTAPSATRPAAAAANPAPTANWPAKPPPTANWPAAAAAKPAATAAPTAEPAAVATAKPSKRRAAEPAASATLAASPSNDGAWPKIPVEESDSLSAKEALPCQRLSAADLSEGGPALYQRLLDRPTIIEGLIDHWPALRLLATPEGFNASYAEHGTLAHRYTEFLNKARAKKMDPETTLFKIKEVIGAMDRHYSVLYHGMPRSARAEMALLDAMRDEGVFDVPAPVARSANTVVLSFGGGTEGVKMANHGFAWVGLVAGRKLWHMAHPDVPRPANPSCADRDSIEVLPNGTHCLQLPGDLMVVPTAWWHATCNMKPWTLGIGGQDSCGLVDCTPDTYATAHERHMNAVFCADPVAGRCWSRPDTGMTREHWMLVDDEQWYPGGADVSS